MMCVHVPTCSFDVCLMAGSGALLKEVTFCSSPSLRKASLQRLYCSG